MRVKLLAVAIVICAATAGVLAQKQFRLIATVVDPNGAEVATVDAKDVRVTEDGTQATIVEVEPIERVPKVQLLIDNGIGMPNTSIGDLRTGVRGFLEALPPGIEVQIVTTAPQPRFLERATTDRVKLLSAVDRLTPDGGAGRFVESLHEATDRVRRDSNEDASYTIVTVGTMSGDVNVRDRDMKETLERVQQHRIKVHAVILSSVNTSASAGIAQTELGQAVTQVSGGRYENIAVPNRLATLLPEIGAQMAPTLGAGAKQFRIVVDRPGGASGDLGKISISVAGMMVPSVTLDSSD